MPKTLAANITLLLGELESFAKKQGLSRRDLSKRIGVPHETLRQWFRTGKSAARPSKRHLTKIEAFLSADQQYAMRWQQTWGEITRWCQTQHRYSDVATLAEELGWDADHLRACIEGAVRPPRLVIEKLAEIAQIEPPGRIIAGEELSRRVDRLKALLSILAEELAWFRDGSQQARDAYRSEMDPFDTGYVASLLTMLFAEDKFRRWLEVTTNRFDYFKGKGAQR